MSPILEYPIQAEFEELLNSCGSMTKALENLGYNFQVSLLNEKISSHEIQRITTLNLDNIPVVLAKSSADINSPQLYSLLKNASLTPIGKFLFSPQAKIYRANLDVTLSPLNEIYDLDLKQYLLSNFNKNQNLWIRNSIFKYLNQKLLLVEIILPALNNFFINS